MNFELAVQSLIDAGVDFIVIDGWSAILHGDAYVRNDLDIFVHRSLANAARIVRALGPFHQSLRDLPTGLPFLWDERTIVNMAIVTLQTDIGPIDILAESAGLGPYSEVKARSMTTEFFDRIVRTLDLQSLIQSKRAAGRPKDLAAVQSLSLLLETTREE